MSRFISALFLLSFSLTYAQMPTLPGLPEMQVTLFQPHIITEHGISEIKATYAYKYDREILHFTKKEITYYFDTDGRLFRRVEMNHYKQSKDSILDEYYYDNKDRINTYLHRDAQSKTVYLYEYEGSSYRESAYAIPTNKKWNSNLNEQYLIWSDSIHSNNNRSTYYNQYGLAYKYVVKRGAISEKELEVSEYMKGGKINRSHYYNYKANGLLTSIQEKNYNKFQFDWTKEFMYFEEDHLKEEHYFKNGILDHIRKISYTSDGLPEFDISRNEITTKMTIIQFEYIK